MKKLIAASLALLTLLGLSSCGIRINPIHSGSERASEENIETPSKPNDKKATQTVDAFENVICKVFESEYGGRVTYPEGFIIDCDASDSPLGKVATFTFFIDSADENEIVIRSRVNTDDEKVQQYIEENKIKLEETEKEFRLSVDGFETNPISEDIIKKLTTEKLKSDIIEKIDSALYYADELDNNYLRGITGDAPQSEEPSKPTEFTLERVFFVIPKEIDFDLYNRKNETNIKHTSDDSSFEDVEIYTNTTTLALSSSNAANNTCVAILSGNNGAYYCAYTSSVLINGTDMTYYNVNVQESKESDTLKSRYDFVSEKEATDYILERISYNDTEKRIIDIPIK